jgi:hypothetical protein
MVLGCLLSEVIVSNAGVLHGHAVKRLMTLTEAHAGTDTRIEALCFKLRWYGQTQILNRKLHFVFRI